mgnify:CR=1 FL=1
MWGLVYICKPLENNVFYKEKVCLHLWYTIIVTVSCWFPVNLLVSVYSGFRYVYIWLFIEKNTLNNFIYFCIYWWVQSQLLYSVINWYQEYNLATPALYKNTQLHVPLHWILVHRSNFIVKMIIYILCLYSYVCRGGYLWLVGKCLVLLCFVTAQFCQTLLWWWLLWYTSLFFLVSYMFDIIVTREKDE